MFSGYIFFKAEKKKDWDREYRYKKFRNTEGLTKTEVRRRNEFIMIARLELSGLSINKIAEEIGKAPSTIKEKIKKKYKKITYTEIKQGVKDGIFDDLRIEQLA